MEREDRGLKYEVVVIGGGATGAGVFLELARRGVRVALFEKGDFSSGTTSRSSRLIHGGIRYLEHLHLDLVMESLREREWIGERFGHMLRPLEIHIPIYRHSKRHPLVVALGVLLYDFLAGRRRVGRSRVYLSPESIPEGLGISRRDLTGLFVFSDYQILMPERLVVANVLEGIRMGGVAHNYARVGTVEIRKGGVELVVDMGGEKLRVLSEVVVNAAGPWADRVRDLAGFTGRLLRPTKGVHLEVEKIGEEALFIESGTDRRLFFVLPFLGHTLVGTTDTDFTGSPDDASVEEEDVKYLERGMRRVFPEMFSRGVKIFSAFAGVRPLLHVPGKPESAVPRRHRVVPEGPEKRMLSVVGGKLTTYRKMAEDCVGKLESLHRRRVKFGSPLPYPFEKPGSEARKYLKHLVGDFGLRDRAAEALFRAYGLRAHEALELVGGERWLAEPAFEETGETPLQILFGFEREMCRKVEDVIARRMLLGKTPGRGIDRLDLIEKVLVACLGKSPGEARDMTEEYRDSVRAGLAWRT